MVYEGLSVKRFNDRYAVIRAQLRTDSCDERRIYKSEDISGHKGGTYMFNTSPKRPDFCLSNDVWQELPRVNFKKKCF